jgi:hypothetical protein
LLAGRSLLVEEVMVVVREGFEEVLVVVQEEGFEEVEALRKAGWFPITEVRQTDH